MLSKKRSVCGMSALEKPSFFKQLSTAKRPVLNNALELIFVQQQLVYNALVLVVEYRTNIKLVPFFGTIASLMPFPNDRASTIDEPSRKKTIAVAWFCRTHPRETKRTVSCSLTSHTPLSNRLQTHRFGEQPYTTGFTDSELQQW